jgi:hypothetical protein
MKARTGKARWQQDFSAATCPAKGDGDGVAVDGFVISAYLQTSVILKFGIVR